MIQSPAGGEKRAREIGFLTPTREPTAGQNKEINGQKKATRKNNQNKNKLKQVDTGRTCLQKHGEKK